MNTQTPLSRPTGTLAALLRHALTLGAAACLTLGLFTALARLIAPRPAASRMIVCVIDRLRTPVNAATELRFPVPGTPYTICPPMDPYFPRPEPAIAVDRVDQVTPDFRDDLRWTEGPVSTPVRIDLGKNFICLPVQRSEPEYPATARRRKLEGQVLVDVAIDRRGRVSHASVAQAEPAGVFDTAALRAVRRWRYPVSSAGASCERTQVRMRFAL